MMNKRGRSGRIIEIRGLKGLLTLVFIVCCLITGFTVFPGFIAMNIWNIITPYVTDMPEMTLLHGVMLWGVVFLIWFAFNGSIPSLHFGCHSTMNEREIQEFVERIKIEQSKEKETVDSKEQESINDNKNPEE